MCGITGIYSQNLNKNTAVQGLDESLRALRYRGPDFSSTWVGEKAALGHARLSIIDTSENGNQPMVDESGDYVLVYNGEIYNYKNLKNQLQDKGHQFKSQSDTEVLLKLFIEYGIQCVEMLNGFFAFAIYHKSKDELYIARDRFGIKPLYYHLDKNSISFASELKALIKYIPKLDISPTALSSYFQLSYIPGPNTIYQNVSKLLPGHFLQIKNGVSQLTKYYDVHKKIESSKQNNFQDQLLETLEQSVQDRLVSDVPLGAFLSGGIDSSVIVALASKHKKNLMTFSVGFKDHKQYDETYYANLVAEKFKTDHHCLKLQTSDLMGAIEDITKYLDEPFADSSAIPVYLLCKYTRKHVTVALSGDGADEIFGGYHKHQAQYLMERSPSMAYLAAKAHPLLKHTNRSRESKIGNKFRQLEKLSRVCAENSNRKERFFDLCSFNPYSKISSLFDPRFLNLTPLHSLDYSSLGLDFQNGKSTEDLLANDVKLCLPNDMLTKVDLFSMANSLEVRTPFLDHRVVELAFRMGTKNKLNSRSRKIILRETFRKILPEELYHRPKKGFEVPLMDMLRGDLNKYLFDELLNEEFIRDQKIFNFQYIKNLRLSLKTNKDQDNQALLWSLYIFQTWYKQNESKLRIREHQPQASLC